jgi:hypothetical protein
MAGLELTANYTYSKALTDDIGYYGAANIQQQYYQQNVYNIHGDWGPAGDDVRQAFNATGTYNLPYGQGRKYGQNSNFLLQELLGGWKFSASTIAYTGFPVTPSSPAEYSNEVFAYTGAARPNQIAPIRITNRSLTHWFGTTAQASYAPQPETGFGDVKTGSLRAPGFFNVDTAFQKNFKTWHDQSLDFRADLFNAFNIASYGNPDNGIADTNFGQISSTRSRERHIQFELKYQF